MFSIKIFELQKKAVQIFSYFDINMEFDCFWIFSRNWSIGNGTRLRKRAILPTVLLHLSKNVILEVGLPMSTFQVDPTKKWTSDLDSPLKVMPKYKILDQ